MSLPRGTDDAVRRLAPSSLRDSAGLKGLSQKDRILRLARARGAHGICATDFLLPGVVDDGPPITRLAARIGDLEGDGFTFNRTGRRNRCQVYVLGAQQDHDVSADPPSSPATAAAETPAASGPGSADTPAPLTLLADHRAPSCAIRGDDAA